MRVFRLLLGVFPLCALTTCAPPTQITFDVRTDVPCGEFESIGLTVARVGQAEERQLTTTTQDCAADGTVNAIGTYAVVPAAGPVEVSVRVVLAEKGVNLEADCTAAKAYKGCIVARRDLAFVAKRSLVVPVDLRLICRDVACDVTTTCNRVGRCVPSRVDPSRCNGDLCEELIEPPPSTVNETPAASPRLSSITVMPTTVPADGVSTSTFTLTLRDGNGAPVANQLVSISADGRNNSWSIEGSTTNDAGVFIARLASIAIESKTVVVNTTDIELQTQVTFFNGTDVGDAGPASDGGGLAWAQQVNVKALNNGAEDAFASAVALSADGNTLAVGAPDEDSSTRGINPLSPNELATNSGAVYIYRRNGTTWTSEAYVKASNSGAGDRFGASLSLSSDGKTLAVGATGEASNATGTGTAGANQTSNSTSGAGAVYVFVRGVSAWAQEEYLKASNTNIGDSFGTAVALSGDGNTIAVGAPGEASSTRTINGSQSNTDADNSGAAYVFRKTGGLWQQQAYVKVSNSEASDRFGCSIALSSDGNSLVVGALNEASGAKGVDGDLESNAAAMSGAAYVFTFPGVTWQQSAYLKPSNTRANQLFGTAVSISGAGDTVAVGSPRESGNATGVNGEQMSATALESGAAYIFRKAASTWSQDAYVKASNTSVYDEFGAALSLSLDGKILVVGARRESSSATGFDGNQENDSATYSGAGYVFGRRVAQWAQLTYAKASNTGATDNFGGCVAVDGTGLTFSVGAAREDSSASGVGGNQADNNSTDSGALYVFGP